MKRIQRYTDLKGKIRARVKPDPEPTVCPHCKKNLIYGGFAICGPCHEPYAKRLRQEIEQEQQCLT